MPQCGINAFWSFGSLVISYYPMTIPMETVWNDITFWGQSKFGENRLINNRLGVAAGVINGRSRTVLLVFPWRHHLGFQWHCCGSLRNDLILKAICFGGFCVDQLFQGKDKTIIRQFQALCSLNGQCPIVHMIIGTLQFGNKVFPFPSMTWLDIVS